MLKPFINRVKFSYVILIFTLIFTDYRLYDHSFPHLFNLIVKHRYEDRVSCNEYVPSVGVNCVGNITDFKACFCSSEDGCNRDSVSVGGGGSGDCSCSGDCSSAISIVNYKAQIILLAFNSLVYMYFVTHR